MAKTANRSDLLIQLLFLSFGGVHRQQRIKSKYAQINTDRKREIVTPQLNYTTLSQ